MTNDDMFHGLAGETVCVHLNHPFDCMQCRVTNLLGRASNTTKKEGKEDMATKKTLKKSVKRTKKIVSKKSV